MFQDLMMKWCKEVTHHLYVDGERKTASTTVEAGNLHIYSESMSSVYYSEKTN